MSFPVGLASGLLPQPLVIKEPEGPPPVIENVLPQNKIKPKGVDASKLIEP